MLSVQILSGGFALLLIAIILATLALLLAWRPTRWAVKKIVYADTTVDYFQCDKMTQGQLQKGLDHDFVTLGRKAVFLHYNHKLGEDCTNHCNMVTNPNKEEGIENE